MNLKQLADQLRLDITARVDRDGRTQHPLLRYLPSARVALPQLEALLTGPGLVRTPRLVREGYVTRLRPRVYTLTERGRVYIDFLRLVEAWDIQRAAIRQSQEEILHARRILRAWRKKMLSRLYVPENIPRQLRIHPGVRWPRW